MTSRGDRPASWWEHVNYGVTVDPATVLERGLPRGVDLGDHGERLLSDLLHFYRDSDVLTDQFRSRPLDRSCASCAKCWAGEDERKPPRNEAGISLPWIGSDYSPGGVVVAGINQYEYGGLFAHWWIYHALEQEMSAGIRHKGSLLAYVAALYSRALRAGIRGERLAADGSLTGREAAREWRRIAFLELVKCSPHGARSKPNEEMWANCPGRYLVRELEILKPRVLIVLSSGIGATRVRLLSEAQGDWREEPGFKQGTLVISGHPVTVLCGDHPAGRRWKRSVPHFQNAGASLGADGFTV